jgi:ubiquitin-conjugating enzyme E2 variant
VHWWNFVFVPLGMAAADLLSGLVHWACDTWGSETMPVIGRRFLHPFRVHHVNPDDFLTRRFLDTNGDVAMLVLPVLAGMFWIPFDSTTDQIVAAFALGFCSVGMWTNQIHQWAHMHKPPRAVQLLQACRVVLRSEVHERHHRPPHVTDYCITTGWCNGALNRLGFFHGLELAVSCLTGAMPRTDD